MYDFDFFETISQDVLRYSALGDVIITGDLTARIGKESDLVENINLDRYINMPTISFDVDRLPVRKSADVKVNTYGYKLLSLCKQILTHTCMRNPCQVQFLICHLWFTVKRFVLKGVKI